jgi:hypothetical protein
MAAGWVVKYRMQGGCSQFQLAGCVAGAAAAAFSRRRPLVDCLPYRRRLAPLQRPLATSQAAASQLLPLILGDVCMLRIEQGVLKSRHLWDKGHVGHRLMR